MSEASTLYFNGVPIWHNPAGLGHFGITLRKQLAENEIIRRMEIRYCMRIVRFGLAGEIANVRCDDRNPERMQL